MAETRWRRTAAMNFRIALQPRAAGKTNNYRSCEHTTTGNLFPLKAPAGGRRARYLRRKRRNAP